MTKPLPSVISEDEIGTSEYLRLREETLRRYTRQHDPYRRRQDPGTGADRPAVARGPALERRDEIRAAQWPEQ